MKKSLIYLAAAVMSLACTRFEELAAPMQTDYIRFSTGDGIAATGTVETKAMENEITCDITDWEYDEDSTETKASLTETLSDSVGVFGYNFTTWGSSVKPTVMYNMKNTVKDGSLTPEKKVLWKKYESGSLRFYAYAPYGKFTLSSKETGGVPYLTYTVPTTNKEQIDILYAQSADVDHSNREAVPLQFHHAMTAVQFRLGIDGATLGSVTISGVNSKGQLALDGTWSDQKTTASYSVEKIDSLLIMVPQTVPTDAKISLTYNDGTKDNTIEASIAGQVWKAGKKVVYTLKKKGEETKYYYFDLNLGNVILTAEEGKQCSGYVNINGTSTEVKVTHSNTNKYYIYLSVDDSKDKDAIIGKIKTSVTGFASKTDWENGVNVKLPEYESDIFFNSHQNDTYMDGKTDWAEFITNNPDPEKVRLAWNKADQIYPTINRIMICGHETNPTDFDVTIANVTSKFFPYSGKNSDGIYNYSSNGYDKMGALTIGESDPETYSKMFKNYHTERVTLRLKGKNMLGRISYTKPHNSDLAEFEHKEAHTGDGRSYFKITSSDGDGSSNGSLMVTLQEGYSCVGALCSLIGSGNSDVNQNETEYPAGVGMISRQMTDFFINGGNVYVGTKRLNGSVFTNNNWLIGCIGGTNSESHITISGGILTSVSNTTAPALGGGGGWKGMGGKGVIDISGGSVYAYTFGVKGSYDSKTNYLSPTAIGGGSTMGEDNGSVGAPCEIRITGGDVYAESRGGVAIGGGMSGRHAGGDCDIEITGGKVRAISKSGTIVDNEVSAANAIGGGRSGTEDGDGGTAIMKISGGIITSGSVGGGKAGRTDGKIGSANIEISGGETSAQFIMAAGASKDPSFKISNGTIKNSSTSSTDFPKVQANGGAVYMESGTCSIQGGTISKCSGTLGGAVYMNGGAFTMTGGTISDCNSTNDGGAVYVEGGNVSVSGGEIYHNIASNGNGGGVYITGGNFEMTGGEIISNTADKDHGGSGTGGGNGGGIYITATDTDPEVKLLDGKIQNNTAELNGGGLCVNMKDAGDHKATITIGQEVVTERDTISPNISQNSASLYGGGMDVQGQGSNITIYSGTVKGNVSTQVKNEDIRNDGGTVDLVGKNEEGKKPQVNVRYNTIKFYANNGVDPEPYDEQRVITSTNSPLRPTEKALAFYKEFFYISSWNTKRDGTGTSYKVDGSGAVMNITEDISLYAQWTQKLVE